MLQIAKEAEVISAAKGARKRPYKRPIQAVLEDEEDEMLVNDPSSSDSDCIIVAARK